MRQTYSAILRSGRLEWESNNPPHIPPGAAMRVSVTLLDASLADEWPETGPAMAAALADFAAAGGPTSVGDLFGNPMEWQRESRVDRSLPGRIERFSTAT